MHEQADKGGTHRIKLDHAKGDPDQDLHIKPDGKAELLTLHRLTGDVVSKKAVKVTSARLESKPEREKRQTEGLAKGIAAMRSPGMSLVRDMFK